jgi:hypothetical protein
MSQPLTLKIPIKNRAGDVVGEKEVVSYAGLLAKAHDEGLQRIDTLIVQLPTDANGQSAVVRAVVSGKQGSFSGVGDASPVNVNPKVVRHLLRMAETRAKARALRDYVNVGVVSLEELGGDDELADDAQPMPSTATGSAPRANKAEARDHGEVRATDAQRRMLWRQALRLHYEGDAATRFLRERSGVNQLELLTKQAASTLIDTLDRDIRAAEDPSRAAE